MFASLLSDVCHGVSSVGAAAAKLLSNTASALQRLFASLPPFWQPDDGVRCTLSVDGSGTVRLRLHTPEQDAEEFKGDDEGPFAQRIMQAAVILAATVIGLVLLRRRSPVH